MGRLPYGVTVGQKFVLVVGIGLKNIVHDLLLNKLKVLHKSLAI